RDVRRSRLRPDRQRAGGDQPARRADRRPGGSRGRTGRQRGAAVRRALCGLVLLCIASACGSRRPPYVVPAPAEAPPPAFKENADWKTAQPADLQVRGKWWEVYGDAQLNTLEERIEVSSESLKRVQAQFLQARAEIGINRADLYPQVGVNPALRSINASNTRA